MSGAGRRREQTRGVVRPGEPAERVALFDDDGTLWAEPLLRVQALFIAGLVDAPRHGHPAWRTANRVADEHATPSERDLAGPLTMVRPAPLLESSA